MNQITPPNSDAVRVITAELGKPDPTQRLAESIKTGSFEPNSQASILGSLFEVVDGVQRFQGLYPNYFKCAVDADTMAQWEKIASDPEFAQIRMLMGLGTQDGEIGEAVTMMDQMMGGALEPVVSGALAQAAGKAADRLTSRDFSAEARGLAKDIGLDGKLSDEQVSALAQFLEGDAKKSVGAMRDIAASGKVDARTYLSTTIQQMNEGIAALERLRAQFQE